MTMMACPTTWLQSEGEDESETNLNAPYQEGTTRHLEGGGIAEFNLDVDCEGSEAKVEPVTQKQREEDPDAECAKMEMSRSGTLCQRMMLCDVYMEILWVHKA